MTGTRFRRTLRLASALAFAAALAAQQQEPEITQKDEPATFRARVDLVAVPVVVRDRQGKTVATLKQDNFRLLDRGQLQHIARFSLEKAGARTAPQVPVEPADPTANAAGAPIPIEAADNFTALVVDDVHLKPGAFAHARDALGHYLDESFAATKSQRFAIYTTSGTSQLEFTGDRDELRRGLGQLLPRARTGPCPQMTLYMADLVVNKRDPDAARAFSDAIDCNSREVLQRTDFETRQALSTLLQVVRRIAVMPGKRAVILVSPGFFTLDRHGPEKMDILDRSIRAGIFINSLDTHGVFAASGEAEQFTSNQILNRLQNDGAFRDADVMAEFADGTGGTFVQKSNNFEEGLRKLAGPPDSYYLLAFSPQNLRMDGSFHALKVTLSGSKEFDNMTVSARKGYYAPSQAGNAAQTARGEIEAALFSREETSDIPADLRTQFFKLGPDSARLTLLVRVDVRKLKFRKENERNRDNVSLVCGLFDRNGVLVTGAYKHIDLRLKDESLEKQLANGLLVRSTVDLKPGVYTIRMVLRDTEGAMMTARNAAVEIPF